MEKTGKVQPVDTPCDFDSKPAVEVDEAGRALCAECVARRSEKKASAEVHAGGTLKSFTQPLEDCVCR